MPVHGPPAAVSAYEGRQEALKTSWVNPNYPSLPNPLPALGVPFFTSSKVDVNGTTGLNPDGTWELSKLYNWDTWKRPLIGERRMHQYGFNQGVRLHWVVSAGDVFRTGWAIHRSADGVNFSLRGIVRYGGEYSPSSGLTVRYTNVQWDVNDASRSLRLVGLNGNGSNWLNRDDWGDHNLQPPASTEIADPTSGSENPQVQISMVDWPATAGSYWYRITPIDGRQFHTLNNLNNPTEYTVNNPSTFSSYNTGLQKDFNVPTGSAIFNPSLGSTSKEIIVRNGWTGIELEGHTLTISIEILNYYSYYLQGNQQEVWAGYLQGGNTGIQDPIYTWQRNPVLGNSTWVDGLLENTTYGIAIAPIIDSTSSSTQPTSEEIGYILEGEVATGTAASLSKPTITNVNYIGPNQWFDGLDYKLYWSNGSGSSYEAQYRIANSTDPWVTTGMNNVQNDQSGDVFVSGPQVKFTDYEFRMRATTGGSNPTVSSWSDVVVES